jgi:hypothetical protein
LSNVYTHMYMMSVDTKVDLLGYLGEILLEIEMSTCIGLRKGKHMISVDKKS